MSNCSHVSPLFLPIPFCFSASHFPSWTTGGLLSLHLSLPALPNITLDLLAKFKYIWKVGREEKKAQKIT